MRAQVPSPRRWSEHDDVMLDAILWLRRVWAKQHERVSLADLGLDPTLATFTVSGLCPRHGQFVSEWTGRVGDTVPVEARCSASRRGCNETAPVFVVV
jgi:hypothetical protein